MKIPVRDRPLLKQDCPPRPGLRNQRKYQTQDEINMIAKERLDSGKTGRFGQNKLPEGMKKQLVFPVATIMCYLLGMFTRKWIKTSLFSKQSWWVHPGYIRPFSPSETKLETRPIWAGDLWRSLQCTSCPCGREGSGLQLPREWGIYPCQVLWWAAGQQGPCPLALIRQETQSKPSYYKYKNS